MGAEPGDLAFLRGDGSRTGPTGLGGGRGGGEFIAGLLGPWGGTRALKVIEGGNQLGARLGLATGASQPGSVQELGAGMFEGCLWSLERSQVVQSPRSERRAAAPDPAAC